MANEIISNPILHAFDQVQNPSIAITLRESDDIIFLSILDNGNGLPEDFNRHEADTFEMTLIAILKDQLNAELKATFDTLNGTLFEVRFEKLQIKGTGSSIVGSSTSTER